MPACGAAIRKQRTAGTETTADLDKEDTDKKKSGEVRTMSAAEEVKSRQLRKTKSEVIRSSEQEAK